MVVIILKEGRQGLIFMQTGSEGRQKIVRREEKISGAKTFR